MNEWVLAGALLTWLVLSLAYALAVERRIKALERGERLNRIVLKTVVKEIFPRKKP